MTQLNALTGMALSADFVAQAQQQDTVAGIPGWVLVFIVLLILIGVVIWVMHYEGQKTSPQRATAPGISPADDLTIIEGIGPKIAGLLQAAGITTFAQLAAADMSRLKQILEAAKLSHIANPTTWSEQAKLAAAGDKEALQKLQDQLKGGKRV